MIRDLPTCRLADWLTCRFTYSPTYHFVLIALLLTLAFGMRLCHLTDLPPGLFHDEAYNTLDAHALAEGLPHPRFYDSWEIYARAIHPVWPPPTTRFPVFLEGNYGREPLFHYLGALAVALAGPQVWALRLVAALAGTAAVLTAYLVTRELFPEGPGRAMKLALLAAAVATGTYNLLAFSRLALRIITLVPLEGLTVALWWRARRDGRLRWWALAGLLLGLSQYTYIPARLLPLILALPTLVWLARRPGRGIPCGHPKLKRGVLVASSVALLVTAPLIAFFIRYPAYLTLRAEAIAADADEHGLAMMVANVGRALWGLVGRGDPNPILNLPGRPLLDIVQTAFFIVGVIICLRQAHRRPESPGAFLLFWAVAMQAPSIVAGVAPTFGRSIGGVLPVVIIVALGMEATWTLIVTRWPSYRLLAGLALSTVLAFSIGLTACDYYVAWADLPDLPHILHEDMAVVGRYIGQLPTDAVVYITPTQKYYATMLLAMGTETGERDWPHDFYGPSGLIPAGDPEREAVYLILEGDTTTAPLLEATFPTGYWDIRDAVFSAYRVPPAADRARPPHLINADFAGLIRLTGFDLPSSRARPGDTLTVQLTWQALESVGRRYTAFVHLLGPQNPATGSPLWAQDDHEPGHATYTTDRWFPGEIIMDAFSLQIPTDAPAGDYTLVTGFYEQGTLERLPRSDTTGDIATIATITLAEEAP